MLPHGVGNNYVNLHPAKIKIPISLIFLPSSFPICSGSTEWQKIAKPGGDNY